MEFLAESTMPDWLAPLHRASVENVLLLVLLQLAVIIIAARVFAILFRKMGQPSVVGEIFAGLALGPSLLGRFCPGISQALFHPNIEGVDSFLADETLRWVFVIFSQIGLILFLFLIGLEFDFSHLRHSGRSAMAISVCGVVLPFGLGLILAPLILPHLEVHAVTGLPVPATGFALFLGTALSITAMPVLGRILLELGITRTRLATITISAAAIGDATGWILLFSVAAVVRGEFTLSSVGLMAVETIAFALGMVYVVRPLVLRWARSAMRRGDGEIKINDLAILLILLMAAAVATNLIGIFAIFGAFFFGAILSSDSEFRQAINRRLRDFVTVFFLPIFFAYTGLRTNIGLLDSGLMWLFFGVLLAAAMIGKFGGCALAARWSGFSWRESACIGTMMNARGLMELVVVNLGYEMKVIPGSVFCMLVLMALITTVMTTPALGRLMWGTELEAPILASGLVRKRAAAARAADDRSETSLRT